MYDLQRNIHVWDYLLGRGWIWLVILRTAEKAVGDVARLLGDWYVGWAVEWSGIYIGLSRF